MGGKAKTSDKSVGYTERRERLLRFLPVYAFNVAAAGRAAGYSVSYATHKLAPQLKRDVEFKKRMEELREQDCRSNDDMTATVDIKLRNILDDLKIPVNTKIKAIELFYRRHGLLTDRQVTETGERERELTAAARAEARRLSVVLMREANEKKETA